MTFRTPPLTGTIGRVAFAAATLRRLTAIAVRSRRRRRVQVDAAIEVGPVLVHVVGAGEEAVHDLTLRADRRDLAARIQELVGIVRQQIEVESVAGELRPVEIPLSRAGP